MRQSGIVGRRTYLFLGALLACSTWASEAHCGNPPQDCDGNGVDDAVDIAVSPPVFEVPERLGLSDSARQMTAGDFDGDGQDELAVVEDERVTVYRRVAGGRYASGTSVNLFDSDTESIAPGRIDGDDALDLVVAGRRQGVRLLRNDGGLSFGVPESLPGDVDSWDVALADFDGDQTLDVASANRRDGAVDIWLNDGAGGFAGPLQVSVALGPTHLVSGDLDEDGDVDLIVAHEIEAGITVLAADGVGGFVVQSFTPLEREPMHIDLGRPQRGDRLELLVGVDGDPAQLLVFPGFSAAALESPSVIPVPGGLLDFEVVDLDGDRLSDVVAVRNFGPDSGLLLRGGTSILNTDGEGIFVPGGMLDVASGDFDGDGHVDLAGAIRSKIHVIRGNGTTQLRGPKRLEFEVEITRVSAADLDGDGHVDLVVSGAEEGSLHILWGDGQGRFERLEVSVGLRYEVYAAIGDLNGDGVNDLFVVSRGAGSNSRGEESTSVVLGQGDRTFAAPRVIARDLFTREVDLGDVDGDGDLDAVFRVDSPRSYGLVLGDGDGGFTLDRHVGRGSFGLATRLLDVDGDLRLDIASPEAVYIQRPDGSFSLRQVLSGRADVRTYDYIHQDRDRRLDLVVADREEPELLYYAGRSRAHFDRPLVSQTPFGADFLELGDLDLDGLADAITGNYDAREFGFSAGLPGGGFADAVELEIWPQLHAETLAIADLDADGRPDLAIGERRGLLLIFNAGSPPGAADCNGNGVPDACDLASGFSFDVDENGVPDDCQADIDGNGVPDLAEIAAGLADDCNENEIPDAWEIESEPDRDCDGNGVLDVCDVVAGTSEDCDRNGYPDACTEFAAGSRFDSALGLATRGELRDLAVGDVDGDGSPNLVVVVDRPARLKVFPGAGASAEAAPRTVLLESSPTSVALADLDGDTFPEVVIGLREPARIAVYGQGAGGQLEFRQSLSTGTDATDVAAADFDADGATDLVVVSSQSLFQVALNDGSGGLRIGGRYLVSRDVLRAVAVGDFNGDGFVDVVTGGTDDRGSPRGLSRRLGNGDGTFSDELTFGDATFPVAPEIVVADFDGDGNEDVAVSDDRGSGPDRLQVFTGRDDGSFDDPLLLDFRLDDFTPVAVGTFDLDDDPDIVLILEPSRSVAIVHGGPGVSFRPPTAYTLGTSPFRAIVADADADGRDDVIALASTISVAVGRSTGGLRAAARGLFSYSTQDFTIADVNLDGVLDLVGWRETGAIDRHPQVGYGLGDGTFSLVRPPIPPLEPNARLPVPATPDQGHGMITTDLDGDGLPEFIQPDPREGIFVYSTTDRGRLGVTEFVRDDTLGTPGDVSAGDFNSDGFVDLVTVHDQHIRVYPGSAEGFVQTALRMGVGGNPTAVVTADVDGDGVLDLLVADGVNAYVGTGRNNGTFEFAPALELGLGVADLRLADLDGDGLGDLVASLEHADQIVVRLGHGDGTFGERRAHAVGRQPAGIAVGDLNLDGRPDIAVALPRSHRVAILVSRADGDLDFEQLLDVGRKASRPHVADMNSDGRPDIALLTLDGIVEVHLNGTAFELDCDGSGVPDICEIRSGKLEDLDGDGVPDPCQPSAQSLRLPGDCNEDGELRAADGICLLGALFLGSPDFPCGERDEISDAATDLLDWQGDARVDISDAIGLFRYLFTGGTPHVLGHDCVPLADCETVGGCD